MIRIALSEPSHQTELPVKSVLCSKGSAVAATKRAPLPPPLPSAPRHQVQRNFDGALHGQWAVRVSSTVGRDGRLAFVFPRHSAREITSQIFLSVPSIDGIEKASLICLNLSTQKRINL